MTESEIKLIGKEFDYYWRDMAEEIYELRARTEDQENRIYDLERSNHTIKNDQT